MYTGDLPVTAAGSFWPNRPRPTGYHPYLKHRSPLYPAHKPWWGYRVIVPTALISYGVIALKSGTLRDWNNHVKEEIWVEHPHSHTSIENYLEYAPAVAVYGLNLAGIKGEHNLRDETFILGISAIIMYSTTAATKSISKEWRPDGSDTKSFPSGHTATAFAAAEFMRREYKDVSPWYGIAGYAAAAATGSLRMYNNRHWLSDVIAGAGVGILSTDIAYWVYPPIKRWLFKNDRPATTIILPYYQQGNLGLGLVHTF